MKIYELSFATIKILRNDIAEVIVHQGIEMDKAMIDEYHNFLLSHMTAPFSLLITKVNSYSYDAEAQENLATLKEINAMAVVSYSHTTKIITEDLATFPRKVEWNLKIFSSRAEALEWLIQQQEAVQTDSKNSDNSSQSKNQTDKSF